VNFPTRPKKSVLATSKANVGVAVVPASEVASNGESNRQIAMLHSKKESTENREGKAGVLYINIDERVSEESLPCSVSCTPLPIILAGVQSLHWQTSPRKLDYYPSAGVVALSALEICRGGAVFF
jgi:hypothetical protein